MYKFLSRNGLTIAFGAGIGISVIFVLIVLFGVGGLTDDELKETSTFDFGLMMTYVLFFASIAAAVAFPVIYMIQNPKEALKGLAGFGVLAIVFLITYAMANGSGESILMEQVKEAQGVSDGVSKYVSGVLNTMGLLLLATFVILIGSEVRNMFK